MNVDLERLGIEAAQRLAFVVQVHDQRSNAVLLYVGNNKTGCAGHRRRPVFRSPGISILSSPAHSTCSGYNESLWAGTARIQVVILRRASRIWLTTAKSKEIFETG